jgi:hypothetical protein
MSSRTQASEPSYELQTLGWKSFQDLCATIIGEVLGQTVQVFLPSHDGGRDGAFNGQWKAGDNAAMEGSFTVQCKFSSKDTSLTVSDLQDELLKAARLARRGLATNYILMTNLGVSGVTEESIRDKFLAINGIERFLLFGRDWITLKIRESPVLRMLVPRVYGLGDLSQILDERAYLQAQDILSALGDDLSKFVVTQAHIRAARALVDQGFVLLLGEPAAGKSTIAASLAVGALDRWECSTLKIRSADEFVEHWNPNEPRQFFWVDDAFGSTQYQKELVYEWNRVLPHMNAAIRKGARVLFTSRDYIYRAARNDLKVTAFPRMNESQVVIDVQQLSQSEKEQILYNHIKMGEQPRYFRTRIKPFLRDIATRSRFLPEIARRLGNPLFTSNLSFDNAAIHKFVDEPLQFLIEVVTNLDPQCRAALALVFMRTGSLSSPIGVALPAAREALVALKGSLVSFVRSGDTATWMFKHPTIGDAYASIVADDPELLDIYMSWTSAEKLILEVTCGDVGLEGVKVVIPESRFARFAQRLNEVELGRTVFRFLGTRCSAKFLAVYLGHRSELLDVISAPTSYLSQSAEVDLLVRLHNENLLPEEWRCRFVDQAKRLAIETPDVDFLGIDRIRELFRQDELESTVALIRAELVPNLSTLVDNWRGSYDGGQEPDEWFQPLRDVLEMLSGEFEGDPAITATLSDVSGEIDWAIERILENAPDVDYEGYYDEDYDGEETRSRSSGDRSIFDDVDE